MKMTPTIIAMITDFGDRDGFTGVMKGVILNLYGEALLVDIAHDVPPQDLWHGSWVLDQAFDHFPAGTFFLCVIDPDVGDPNQLKLAVYFEEQKKGLILPDNGLATRVMARYGDEARCFSIENQALFREGMQPSQTFHGRDIYAPIAARLAKAYHQQTLNATLTSLGPELLPEGLMALELKPAHRDAKRRIVGQVDVVDTFGNLITNVPAAWLAEETGMYRIELADKTVSLPYVSHYTSLRAEGQPFVLTPGSHGMVEMVSPNGNAQHALSVDPGTTFSLMEAR